MSEPGKPFTSLELLSPMLGMELWLLTVGSEPCLDTGMLSLYERNRAAKFAYDRDRVRYIAAHVALRQLLSARSGEPPARLEFERGAHGKPRLRGDTCTFNLSRSDQFALIAIAEQGDIGVDIECVRSITDAHRLASELFTVNERAEVTASDESHAALLRCWTRKEAVVKAVGCGLSVEPRSFDAGALPAQRSLEVRTCGDTVTVNVISVRPKAHLVAAVARVA